MHVVLCEHHCVVYFFHAVLLECLSSLFLCLLLLFLDTNKTCAMHVPFIAQCLHAWRPPCHGTVASTTSRSRLRKGRRKASRGAWRRHWVRVLLNMHV